MVLYSSIYFLTIYSRLLFITGIADDTASILWDFYKNFHGKSKLVYQTRFVLRTNLENLLLSLYTKEIFTMLGSDFKPSFQAPYRLKFEQTLLNCLWEADTSLPPDVSQRTAFLDAIAFSYGRYLLYFLMVAPYFMKDMLPILETLLSNDTKERKSAKQAQDIQNNMNNLDDIYSRFEINTKFDLLSEMKLDDNKSLLSLDAKDFVNAVVHAAKEEIWTKTQIDNHQDYTNWNPFFPIPFLTKQLEILSSSNAIHTRGENRHLFPQLLECLNQFHKEDKAFNIDISPKKRKRSPKTDDNR